jgi:hypothetical protein
MRSGSVAGPPGGLDPLRATKARPGGLAARVLRALAHARGVRSAARGRPGSATPSDRTGNGGAGVVDTSTSQYLLQAVAACRKSASAPSGWVSGNRSILNTYASAKCFRPQGLRASARRAFAVLASIWRLAQPTPPRTSMRRLAAVQGECADARLDLAAVVARICRVISGGMRAAGPRRVRTTAVPCCPSRRWRAGFRPG